MFKQILHQYLVYVDGSGDEESSVMHGLVRKLGLRIAKDENENMSERERLLFPVLQKLQGQSLRGKELSICGDAEEVWPEGVGALYLVSFIARNSGLSVLPHTVFLSTNLRIFDMSGFPCGIGQSHTLVELKLDMRCNIKRLPDEITILQHLRVLSPGECRKLKELPEGLRKLTKLLSMHVTECAELKSFLSSIYEMTDLQKLDVSGCTGLEYICENVLSPDNVENSNLSGWKILPENSEGIRSLTSLQRL